MTSRIISSGEATCKLSTVPNVPLVSVSKITPEKIAKTAPCTDVATINNGRCMNCATNPPTNALTPIIANDVQLTCGSNNGVFVSRITKNANPPPKPIPTKNKPARKKNVTNPKPINAPITPTPMITIGWALVMT